MILAALSADYVAVYSTATGQIEKRIPLRSNDANINQLAISGDKRFAAVTCGHVPAREETKGWVNFIDLQTDEVISRELPHPLFYCLSSLSWDGRMFAVGCHNHVLVMDVASGTTRELEFEKIVKSVAFSPDDELLACAETSGVTHIYDTESLELIDSVQTDKEYTGSIAFSPDSRFFATVGFDNRIKMFQTASRRLVREFKECDMYLTFVRFSPDGRRLVTGSMDGKVRIWDVETNEELISFDVPRNWYPVAAFSPDANSLLIGCADQVRIIGGERNGEIRKLTVAELNAIYCQNLTIKSKGDW